MAHTSAADLAHGLKGAKFPLHKKDLVSLARKNGVASEVLKTFEGMPDGEYHSVTEVEHAFSGTGGAGGAHTGSHSGGSHKGDATSAAQKGGQHSHGGHKG